MASSGDMRQSQATLYEGDPNSKRTWRTVYRVVTILLDITVLCVSIVAVVRMSTITTRDIDNSISSSITSLSADYQPIWSDTHQKVNSIFKEVGITIPITLDKMQVEMGTAVNIITDAVRQLQGVNGSAGFSITNSPEYSGGIDTLIYPLNSLNGKALAVSDLLEHPSFIPAPTTSHGCTRIPTFHLGYRHWCYSHNTIESGCHDAGESIMYISMGAVGVGHRGKPVFTTSAATILDDGKTRKSCSIIANPNGCDVLCSLVKQTENEDYADPTPTPMIHGRLHFNGTYTESELDPTLFNNHWVAQYPAVGSGVVSHGKLFFPLYGGISPKSKLFNELKSFAYFTHNAELKCENLTERQKEDLYNAYRPGKIAGSLWAQGVVTCNLTNLADCKIAIANTSTMMMAAEGRLQLVQDKIVLYQRSSSWWPVLIYYDILISDLISADHLEVVNWTPYPQSKFPRPTWTKGVCEKPAICPAVCVTGVYQDVWVVSIGSQSNETVVVGGYLDAAAARQDPWIAAANQYNWLVRRRLFTSQTEAAYSSTTCFRNTKQDRVFCLTIMEVTDNLLGDWRIAPLLYEVTVADMQQGNRNYAPMGRMGTNKFQYYTPGDKYTPQH
nr:hemagglutinin-neuraminidase protein [Avian metaavulavirus 6]